MPRALPLPPLTEPPSPHSSHQDNGRTLFMGWFNVGLSCLTAPREVFFDPEVTRLVARPVHELEALRDGTLADMKPLDLPPGSSMQVFKDSLTFDLEINVTLQSTPLQFVVAVAAKSAIEAVVMVNVSVSSAMSNGQRQVNVTGNFPGFVAPMSFLIGKSHSILPVRVLGDRTVAEIFVAGAAVTAPIGNTINSTGAYVRAGDSGLSIQSAKAWDMGCGWAKYP